MRRNLRRTFAFLLVSLMLTSNLNCRASAPSLSASAYILIDADSGRVLCTQNEIREMSIASTTKIMTALIALEHGRLSDKVTVKKTHLKEGSSMYLAEGEVLTLEDLLYGLLLPSGNDAAECIADYCGGGTEQFVAWMNEKAAALGLMHTHFANPSGLDNQGHFSCALDMAQLAAYAMQNSTFMRICSTATANVGSRTMANHNKLLLRLDGCIGLKTGYTGDAGRTLVSCVQRDGMRLIAVTLNAPNDWDDHTALYNYGFAAYRCSCAVRCGEKVATIAVDGGEKKEVSAAAKDSFCYSVADGEQLTTSISLSKSVSAPITAGQKLGEMAVLLDGNEVGRVDLVCLESVAAIQKKSSFADWFVRVLSK